MNNSLNFSRNLIIFGIPLSLLGTLVFLMKSPYYIENPIMDLAISIDLLISVPIVYFLLIQKTKIPKTTVIPLMLGGLLIGTYFLPQENQTYLRIFKTWALPVIEISLLTFVSLKIRSAVKKYKSLQHTSPDFFDTLKEVCHEILPRNVALLFATEIAVIYYGFINWKKPKLQDNEFTYHKKSGSPALFGAFIFLIAIETMALHFLILQWSSIAAWILTILSIYTAIQILGFAKSLSKRPISINKNGLNLKYGILNETEISFDNIKKIEISSKELEKNEFTKTISPLGELESHNIIIHLNKESKLLGLYGMKKKFKILKLHIDEPLEFKNKVDNALKINSEK
ncbi:hypothetical protein [Psychroflexus aestuariivivens]|uniref:hypothetical protein n=1 Tax=Psychroflexus aestuariivivens TaxID=1795040 RepID=UPI000FDB6F66|nr:hypothetical protein [Psychroflexus aestuariivivens]